MPNEADAGADSEPSSIDMSPRLKGYAENLWRRFPEVFIVLGASGMHDVSGKNEAVHHRIIETTSWKVIEIALPRREQSSINACLEDGLSAAEAKALRVRLFGQGGQGEGTTSDSETDGDFHDYADEEDARTDAAQARGAGGLVGRSGHRSSAVSGEHRGSLIDKRRDSGGSRGARGDSLVSVDRRSSGFSVRSSAHSALHSVSATEHQTSGGSIRRENHDGSAEGFSPISTSSSSLASRRKMCNLKPVVTARPEGGRSVVRMAHLDRQAYRGPQLAQRPREQPAAAAGPPGRGPGGGFDPESPGACIQRIGSLRRSNTGHPPRPDLGTAGVSPGSRMQSAVQQRAAHRRTG